MIILATKGVVTLLALLIMMVLVIEFAPPEWVASQAQKAMSEQVGATVTIEAIDFHLISPHPSVTVSNASISAQMSPETQARVKIGSLNGSIHLFKLFTGELYIKQLVVQDSLLFAAVDSAGNQNWQYLLQEDKSTVSLPNRTDEPVSVTLPSIEQLTLNKIQLDILDAQRSLDAQLQMTLNGSTLEATQATMNATGTINALPAELEFTTNLLAETLRENQALTVDLNAKIGGSEISVDGSIADLESIQGVELSFSTSAPGLGDMEVLTGLALPVLPPLAVAGKLQVDDSEFVFKRVDGTLGESNLQGDVRINPSASPPTVYANIISTQLDLDDLAGVLGGAPDQAETASNQQETETTDSNAKGEPVLADDPIALIALASYFNGAIEYRADAIKSPFWPIQSLDIRTEIQGTDVIIDPLQIGVAGGDVAGSLKMDTALTPVQSEVTLQFQRVNIGQLLNALDVDDESFGILGGRLRYWLEGDSIAKMAASADGGMFLLMTQGKLDALLVELAGVDLFESLTVLIDPEQIRTAINCAYLDLQSESGINDIATLVLDTDDVVFLADGVIDLNDESVDLIIEPHPKDASILAAQTAAYISGTLSDLSVQPGRTLYARAAAATILATLASPAAALIPFVETGIGSDSAYCDGMISALDDARE